MRPGRQESISPPPVASGDGRTCRVKVLRGNLPPATVQDTMQLGHEEVRERFRLACQAHVIADCTIMAMPPKAESGHQILAAGNGLPAAGAAIDAGVEKHVIRATSIAGSLVDLASGEQLAAVGSVNPQTIYGGDLMSRIAFAQFDDKKLTTLRARALTAVNDFIKEACRKSGISPGHVYKLVIAGNTCMHHVFLGIDVSYVGLAPYAPVVRNSLTVAAGELPLKGAPNAMVCFLPIVAGFVGADTVAAMLATRIFESDGVRVLVDIGTNGESATTGAIRRSRRCGGRCSPRRTYSS